MARIEIPEGEGHEVSRVWSIAPHMGKGVHALSKAVYEEVVYLSVNVKPLGCGARN